MLNEKITINTTLSYFLWKYPRALKGYCIVKCSCFDSAINGAVSSQDKKRGTTSLDFDGVLQSLLSMCVYVCMCVAVSLSVRAL